MCLQPAMKGIKIKKRNRRHGFSPASVNKICNCRRENDRFSLGNDSHQPFNCMHIFRWSGLSEFNHGLTAVMNLNDLMIIFVIRRNSNWWICFIHCLRRDLDSEGSRNLNILNTQLSANEVLKRSRRKGSFRIVSKY